MRRYLILALTATSAAASPPPGISQATDWLVSFRGAALAAGVGSTTVPQPGGAVPGLVLSNGLLSRTFALAPCFATVDLQLLPTRTRFVRALAPEAQLSLNGTTYGVGGCVGQPRPEFLAPALVSLMPLPGSLAFVSYEVTPTAADFAWTPGTRFAPNVSWPATGVQLTLHFAASAATNTFDPASPVFGDFYANTEIQCQGANADQCLQASPGTAHGCDNATVVGQCSFPRARAVELCRAWPACAGVQCNTDRDDCQARAAPLMLGFMSASYNSSWRVGAPPAALAGVDVAVHYELYDGLPVYKKWITVTSAAGGASVVVDDVLIDLMRAPNFVPEQVMAFLIDPQSPAPFSQQIVPDVASNFPGRTQQLWFFDPEWDACCDQELHIGHTYYTYMRLGYGFDINFGNSTGPAALVTPSAPFTSIAARLLFHDTFDYERQGLGARRMQTYLAPQLRESPLYSYLTDISTTEIFRLGISQAAAAGMDLVIVSYGANGYCGLCPAQVKNSSWVAWFKSNVDFARTLGVGVSAYTLMQANGWGEDVPLAEQVLQRDGTRGGIACFATDWHAAYRQSVLDFVAETGMVGVETDGQYEGAYCGDKNATGDHRHNGGANSWHAQMEATASFNVALKALGGYQTGADAYLWSGANRWNHVDTDAGFRIPSFHEYVAVGRDYVYDSTVLRLHSSGGYLLFDLTRVTLNNSECPSRLACIDLGLASFLGQGITGVVSGESIWDADDPDAKEIEGLFRNWTALWRAHRPILTSEASLHIARPSLRALEATVHLDATRGAAEVGFLSVYNPTPAALSDTIAVSLYYANLAPFSRVSVSQVFPHAPPGPAVEQTVGADGGGVYDVMVHVTVAGMGYALYSFALPPA